MGFLDWFKSKAPSATGVTVARTNPLTYSLSYGKKKGLLVISGASTSACVFHVPPSLDMSKSVVVAAWDWRAALADAAESEVLAWVTESNSEGSTAVRSIVESIKNTLVQYNTIEQCMAALETMSLKGLPIARDNPFAQKLIAGSATTVLSDSPISHD